MNLSAHSLNIGYRSHPLQEGLKLTIAPGEFIALVGPNGSGKSTLIKTLSGIIPPLSGKVIIQQKELHKLSVEELSTVVSLVLTETLDAPYLKVETLVSFGRYPHTNWQAKLKPSDREIIQRSMEQCCVEHLAQSVISELSDGERQRVAVARALAQDTALIILDEPTAHLDLKNRVDLMLLLRNLAHEANKSILMSTHELSLALELCDYICLLPDQKSYIGGLPEELMHNGILETVYPSDLLRFDYELKGFRLVLKSHFSFWCEGPESLKRMTEQALVRIGGQLDPKASIKIIILESEWILANHKFGSLLELLRYLRKQT